MLKLDSGTAGMKVVKHVSEFAERRKRTCKK
jgi:hypothetical protein